MQALSEAHGPPCPVEPPVWERLRKSALEFRDKLAVASLHQPSSLYGIAGDHKGTDYLRWTYADLYRAVGILSAFISDQTVGRTTSVVTVLHNRVEFILAFWAAHKLGCPFVPLSPHAFGNKDEIQHILSLIGNVIIISQDEETSKKIDSVEGCFVAKLTTAPTSSDASWTTFHNIFRAHESPSPIGNSPKIPVEAKDIVTILFTSGTTSRPKGVPHTSTTLNAFCQNLSLGGRSPSHIFCSSLPNNHAMGYFYTLHFMMNAGAIVYPSLSFDAPATIRALETEQATHTALVPTMLYALCETFKGSSASLQAPLQDVCLSGASVTPSMLHQVVAGLGSKAVSIGFGMTEGSPIWSEPRKCAEDLIDGTYTIVGGVVPGARVRLCAPGTHDPVNLGEQGEVHQSGPGVVPGYLGGHGDESFYVDENQIRWFLTGDQAIMHPDGRFSITGRYKEIIVRGGKNVSPASVENILSEYLGLSVCVVGVKDPIAGELLVVVVAKKDAADLLEIRNIVVQQMGPSCAPDAVISLEELGLADYPKTVSGKIQRTKLGNIISTWKSKTDKTHAEAPHQEVAKYGLLRAYNKATGIPIQNLDMDLPVFNFSDSISLLRVRDFLKRDLNATLSVDELTRYLTIRSQIDLLESRLTSSVHAGNPEGAARTNLGPPTSEEMKVLFGGAESENAMMEKVSEMLIKRGLQGWESVGAVMLAQDYIQAMLKSQIIDTFNFAIAIICKDASKDELRLALKAALANHPLFTSFYAYDASETAHYVTIKPSKALWDLCLIDYGALKSREDVQQLALNYPFPEHATHPGPLFRCLLVDVMDTGSSAMVYYLHHMVHDASSHRLFLQDLEEALHYPRRPLKPRVEYKAWCDAFSALRMSPQATAAVEYHVKRLTGLHKHFEGIYPKALTPRAGITESPDGIDHTFDAPGLRDLYKADSGILAVVVLKAAMAIVDVHRTGYTHALFSNLEASRKRFPFVPDSLNAIHPGAFEASDVNGPVMQGVCNLIEVLPDERVLPFLQRLKREQGELTKYADAPLLRIIDALNADGSGSGDLMVEVHRAQFLTWVPGFLGEYNSFDVAQLTIRCAVGLVVVAGLGGPDGTTFIMTMRWDVANYSRDQTRAYLEDLEFVVSWLTDHRNFGKLVVNLLEDLTSSHVV